MIKLRRGLSWIFDARISVEKVIVFPITIIEGELKAEPSASKLPPTGGAVSFHPSHPKADSGRSERKEIFLRSFI